MTEQEILNHLEGSALSFIGTIERLRAATMADLPVDDHTAVVHVDQVLHAPKTLQRLSGMSVTVQLSPNVAVPGPGDSATFFTNPSVFGEGLAVTEVARVPVADTQPYLATAAPGEGPLERLQTVVADQHLRSHAQQADAVIIGKVARLEDAGLSSFSEHDPDWWRATLEVVHVESGPVTGPQIQILYANSQDVRWRNSPKPRASQEGLWLLHATAGELRGAAPFQIIHPEDYQPVTRADQLRGGGG
jgi:hypothetical protein